MSGSIHLRVLPGGEGHGSSQDALFEAWLPVVLRWCARLGGPKVDAEDAAHDVLVTALTRLHTLRNPDDFPAWLFGITRRTLAWHRRRAWVKRWVPGFVPEVVESRPSPERAAESQELGVRVQEVLSGLPIELREVLILCDLEERPDEAVAAMLNIPVGTVKSRLRRARRTLSAAAIAAGLGPDALGPEHRGAGAPHPAEGP